MARSCLVALISLESIFTTGNIQHADIQITVWQKFTSYSCGRVRTVQHNSIQFDSV